MSNCKLPKTAQAMFKLAGDNKCDGCNVGGIDKCGVDPTTPQVWDRAAIIKEANYSGVYPPIGKDGMLQW